LLVPRSARMHPDHCHALQRRAWWCVSTCIWKSFVPPKRNSNWFLFKLDRGTSFASLSSNCLFLEQRQSTVLLISCWLVARPYVAPITHLLAGVSAVCPPKHSARYTVRAASTSPVRDALHCQVTFGTGFYFLLDMYNWSINLLYLSRYNKRWFLAESLKFATIFWIHFYILVRFVADSCPQHILS